MTPIQHLMHMATFYDQGVLSFMEHQEKAARGECKECAEYYAQSVPSPVPIPPLDPCQ